MKKNKNWLNDAEISQNYLDTLNTEGEIAAFKLGMQHGAKAALKQMTKRLEEPGKSQSSRLTVHEEKIEDIKVGLTN